MGNKSTTKPTNDVKPQISSDSIELEDNSFSISEQLSLILGFNNDTQTNSTKLFVTDPTKINQEYKRCASVVDAVVQMISYTEQVECDSNLGKIKQEGPGRPKGKKKKAKWTYRALFRNQIGGRRVQILSP